jgi:hypothetical protein
VRDDDDDNDDDVSEIIDEDEKLKSVVNYKVTICCNYDTFVTLFKHSSCILVSVSCWHFLLL